MTIDFPPSFYFVRNYYYGDERARWADVGQRGDKQNPQKKSCHAGTGLYETETNNAI